VKRFSLCVLGNSHTAAIKHAWERQPPRVADGFEMQFFAAAQKQLDKLAFKDGQFEAGSEQLRRKFFQTSSSHAPVDIAAYDGFLLVGLGFDIDVTNWGGSVSTPEEARWEEVRELVSDACFREIARYRLLGTLAVRFARDIRRASRAPMLLAAVPFPSELAMNTKRAQKLPQLREDGYLGPFIARCKDAAEELMAEMDCGIVWQDASTLARPGFTRKEFNVNGAVFSERGDDPDDLEHMNADFGLLTLNNVLARLEALAPGRILAP